MSEAPTPAPTPDPAPEAWHTGIDGDLLGFATNKGWKLDDPKTAFSAAAKAYQEAAKFVGAPPEEMLRIPKANAAESDIRAYWGRIGVPAEAKDYDLSALKYSDGKEIEQGLADMIREAAHTSRVPKDKVTDFASRMIKFREGEQKTAATERSAIVQEQNQLLDKNWGTNKTYNMAVSQRALEDLGKAAGLTPEQTKQGWDAISSGQHIGGAYAMEMLLAIAKKISEPGSLISTQQGSNNNGTMSVQQAIARIDELKADRDWGKRWSAGGAAEKREWTELHKIAGEEIMRRRFMGAA